MKQNDYTQAVRNIAWGNIMLLLNINLGINGNTVDFLPGWLGYLLFYNAIVAIGTVNRQTSLLKPLAILLGVTEAVLWTADLLGLTFNLPVISMIKSVLKMYFMFQLLTDIRDIAQSHNSRYTGSIRATRALITVCDSFIYTAGYISDLLLHNTIVMIVFGVTGVIMALATVYQAVILFRYAKEEKKKEELL